MQILITGSRGVIGRQLRDELESRGHSVYGIDLVHSHESRASYRRCDIRDYYNLSHLFMEMKFDVVYHCAAEFGRHNGDEYPNELWSTNVLGLKNLIRMQEVHGFRMVFFSTSEVYGDFSGVMSETVMDTEEIRQLNDYAMSKWVGEQLIMRSMRERHTDTVRVRLFNTYGREPYTHYRSVNSRFIYNAIHGLPLLVYRGHIRTSTYIDDTCRTLANIADMWHRGLVYNIGGDVAHTIEELAEMTVDAAGVSRDLIHYSDPEPNTTLCKYVSCALAVRDLAHAPQLSLHDGIQASIYWMRQYYSKL